MPEYDNRLSPLKNTGSDDCFRDIHDLEWTENCEPALRQTGYPAGCCAGFSIQRANRFFPLKSDRPNTKVTTWAKINHSRARLITTDATSNQKANADWSSDTCVRRADTWASYPDTAASMFSSPVSSLDVPLPRTETTAVEVPAFASRMPSRISWTPSVRLATPSDS